MFENHDEFIILCMSHSSSVLMASNVTQHTMSMDKRWAGGGVERDQEAFLYYIGYN